MDLKTKLNDEIIFYKKAQSTHTIYYLNARSIYTIEDFINCDVEKITSTPVTRKIYRAIQKILRYKYLGESLVTEVMLEKEYSEDDNRNKILGNKLRKDLEILGLRSNFGISDKEVIDKKIINKNGTFKMIDIILNGEGILFDTFHLREFYIDYYNTQMKKENVEKVVVENNKKSSNILNQKNELDILKNELVSLLNQKKELDTKISLLLEQINTLEGGKNINARK